MIKHLQGFMRGTQGIPFGERVMPGYIFANKEKPGSTKIEYQIEQRGDKWWLQRRVLIVRPGLVDEIHYHWFGGYDSEAACQEQLQRHKDMEQSSPELIPTDIRT